ncbi:MAG: hypothetical protein ACLTBV_25220 [Enterocloster bolteae]
MADCLEEAGFTQLHEGEKWELTEGGSYYVTRNGSSIVSFKVPGKAFFPVSRSWPATVIPPPLKSRKIRRWRQRTTSVKLNVEKYGGMLCAPWFDRPLSVAGRLAVKEGNRIAAKLVKRWTAICL